jgi:tetratricopeptide (TPR) repeat protein
MAIALACQWSAHPFAAAADKANAISAGEGRASQHTAESGQANVEASLGSPSGPSGSGTARSRVLEGKAETTAVKDSTAVGAQGSQFYLQGAAALDSKKYRQAAELFRRSAGCFEQAGLDKFQAQALFAEAQAVRLSGRASEAAKLYQAAIDQFNEYDPLSPYLKAALDNLKKVAPSLTGRVNRDEARLRALTNPKCIMTVDRNILLKVGLSEYGSSKLLAEKATSDVPKDFVDKTIHKAFVRMNCLETAELGSNSITAENRWYTLLAHGKTIAIPASSSFMAPVIDVKIN